MQNAHNFTLIVIVQAASNIGMRRYERKVGIEISFILCHLL